jgi:hypothetical protein
MPSPIGHALAGAAAGWVLAGPAADGGQPDRRRLWRLGGLFALLAVLPDLDLLTPSLHRGPSHSVGAAVIAGMAAGALSRQARVGLAAAAAYGTHVLLDWLGTDNTPPLGLMALWPLSGEFYISDVHLFDGISRRYWLLDSWLHNLRAIARELLILLPPAALVCWLRLYARRAPTPRGKADASRRA